MNSKATKAIVDKVQHALTETNSGSTVKDALNRVEGVMDEIKGTQVRQGTSPTTPTDRGLGPGRCSAASTGTCTCQGSALRSTRMSPHKLPVPSVMMNQ